MMHLDGHGVVLRTNGTGIWSSKRTGVEITRMELIEGPGNYSELRVFFDDMTWFNSVDGLIYTDNGWLKELKSFFKNRGYKTWAQIDYSEQGMQGSDYVSLDATESFANEFIHSEKGG